MTEPSPTPTTDDLRRIFCTAISGCSEDRWCAGWLIGIEDVIRREGGGWTVLARLAGGWPQGLDGQDGWAPLTPDEVATADACLAALPVTGT